MVNQISKFGSKLENFYNKLGNILLFEYRENNSTLNPQEKKKIGIWNFLPSIWY